MSNSFNIESTSSINKNQENIDEFKKKFDLTNYKQNSFKANIFGITITEIIGFSILYFSLFEYLLKTRNMAILVSFALILAILSSILSSFLLVKTLYQNKYYEYSKIATINKQIKENFSEKFFSELNDKLHKGSIIPSDKNIKVCDSEYLTKFIIYFLKVHKKSKQNENQYSLLEIFIIGFDIIDTNIDKTIKKDMREYFSSVLLSFLYLEASSRKNLKNSQEIENFSDIVDNRFSRESHKKINKFTDSNMDIFYELFFFDAKNNSIQKNLSKETEFQSLKKYKDKFMKENEEKVGLNFHR